MAKKRVKKFNARPHHLAAAVLILIIIVIAGVIFYNSEPILGATYTFIQTSWSGGTSTSTTVHPTNQTNWTYYSSKDANITSGTELQLTIEATSTLQTSASHFNAGTFSTATTTGSGDSVSVVLSQETGVAVSRIAGGTYHSCALLENGNVYCWGKNNTGQLGQNSTSTSVTTPVRVLKGVAASGDNDGTYLNNIKSIEAGLDFTCAVSNNNNIYCWGRNNYQSLGTGDGSDRYAPARIVKGMSVSGDNDGTYLTNIKSIAISAGNYFNCAVSNNDNLYCWGLNTYGQLGTNNFTEISYPVRVLKGAADSGDNDGTYLTNVKSVSAGAFHACAVSNNNNPYCWGENSNGALGQNSTSTSVTTPVRVLKGAAASGDNDGTYLNNIDVVIGGSGASTDEYTCAISNNDNPYCWGSNTGGQLGDNSMNDSYTPIRVLKGAAASGDNDGTYLNNVKSLISSHRHVCSVSNNDNIYCWGWQGWGELGNGVAADANALLPLKPYKGNAVSGDNDSTYLTNIKSVMNGRAEHTCVISNNNNFYCFGYNDNGQLGDNSATYRSTPIRVLSGTAPTGTYLYAGVAYNSSGTFTSNVIDVGAYTASWGNLSWTASGSGTLTMKARSCVNSDCSGATAWTSCSNITSGSALSTGSCATDGYRYVQYQASLSTADITLSPSLDDVTIGSNIYPLSQNIISSAYDSTDAANVIAGLSWNEDATLPANTSVTVSLKTASSSADLTAASWSDFTNATANCTKNGTAVSCSASAIPTGLKDGNGDRWFQYKITLTSNGVSTPTFSDITITYVVNAPPEFNSSFGTNGISVSQIATSTDANWGKVQIQYAVRDTDTNSGTNTPGYITPSFEYNTGSGWTAITSEYLASGDLDNKAVATSTYNTYTATWDAQTQIVSDVYTASAQIRMTINDNEAANNTAQATGGNFILDTNAPSVSTFTINSSADTISLNISDNTNIEYRLSNSSGGGEWQTVGNNSTSTSGISWIFTGAPSYEIVYLQARDVYGNSVSATATTPYMPENFEIKDVSNIQTDAYKEFINWGVYTATTTAQFSSYKLYRSTDGSNFSLLSTISSQSLNYYMDATVASSTTYYYKAALVDTDGDISNYTAIVSDLPNGQGGSDTTAPVISSVSVAETKSTWAKITWTTDEASNSKVEYSVAPSKAYGSSQTVDTMVTSHTATITDLTPNTQYYFRVKSKDIVDNEATDDNSGAGYTFTTQGGPVISDVSVTNVSDTSAAITWNTNTESDSYVYYSTNSSLSNALSAGTATRVSTSTGGYYQHNVDLTGLSSRTRYYYYVQSTDANSNISTDKNTNNSYYYFDTTYDTNPPTISNVAVPVKTATTMVIIWNTDELADGQIEYGTASGVYANSTTIDSTLSIGHTAVLSGLTAETKYYYRIKSNDSQGNLGTSSELSETTTSDSEIRIVYVGGGGGGGPATDTTSPQISDVKVSKTGAFDAEITFNTNEVTTGFVLYGKGKDYGNTAGSSDFKTQHQIKISGLKLGTEYHFQVKAQDKGGNSSKSDDYTFTTKFAAEDLKDLVSLDNASQFQEQLEGIIESVMPSLVPPFVSNVEVGDITEDSAIIKWKTNVPAYGLTAYASDADYSIKSKEDNLYSVEISQTESKEKEHRSEIKNLSPGTLYHVQVKSFVFSGVIGKSQDTTFYTKTSKVKPEIVKIGNTQAEIRWITDSETSSFVEYRDLKSGKVGRTGDSAKVKTHSIVFDNLLQDTSYEIKVFGYDANNNIIEGDPITLKTKKDIVPPVISSIKINNALLPGRTDRLQTVISWQTDEPANSLVYFEEGAGTNEVAMNEVGNKHEFTTDHIVIITTLKPSKIYRVRVVSFDESDNMVSSPARTILTPRSAESVFDVITKNLQETFGFLKNLKQ